MTDRTFRQYALGFGTTPAEVVVQIDGNTVYTGPVTTVDEPVPAMPNSEYTIDNVAWTWQDELLFTGTKSISVTVTKSPLLLARTLANNPMRNPDLYGSFSSVEIDGVIYQDPFTDESIDGVSQTGQFNPSLPGQWWWRIPAGSTFTATMHVTAPPLVPYVVFDSVPTTISAGSTGEFLIRIPIVHPDHPLPHTFDWKIINDTTVNEDFVAVSGNVEFVTANSAISISTVANANPGDFQLEILTLEGNSVITSEHVSIT